MNIHTKIYIFFGVCAAILVAWYALNPVSKVVTPPQDGRTSGEVSVVDKDSITVSTLSYGQGVGPTKTGSKTFMVNPATKIHTQILRDRAVFDAELKEFQEKMKAAMAASSSSTPPLAPVPFTEKILLLSDLVPGMLVTVTPSPSDPMRAADILVTTPPPQPIMPPAPAPAPDAAPAPTAPKP